MKKVILVHPSSIPHGAHWWLLISLWPKKKTPNFFLKKSEKEN